MKKVLILVVVGLVFAASFPLANLLSSPKAPDVTAEKKAAYPDYVKVADLLVAKCKDCHSSFTHYPWYFSLPVAKGIMDKDVFAGREAWEISDALSTSYGQMSEKQLAKFESSIRMDTMPPGKYVALHWKASLSSDDKKMLMDWIYKYRTQIIPSGGVALEFLGEPIVPIPLKRELHEAKVALGNKLFHDVRLSGDDTVSCASCHGLDKGGTDQAKFATGIRKQMGDINSPTVYNATFNFLQFWDGRAKDLKEQAAGPVANPIEMGAKWDEVVTKLKGVPEYVKAIQEIYVQEITEDNVTDAIAVFEDSLITPNSRFDQYLKGNKTALVDDEIKGYELFKNKGCISCHFGVAMGGTHFEKMGLKKDYFAFRGNIIKPDHGRFNVTQKEEDRHKFKVPILRNITVTYPYFHDGHTSKLEDVIKIMGEYQSGITLSEKEIDQIKAFLAAQTGEYDGKMLQ